MAILDLPAKLPPKPACFTWQQQAEGNGCGQLHCMGVLSVQPRISTCAIQKQLSAPCLTACCINWQLTDMLQRHACSSHKHTVLGTALCPIRATGREFTPISVILQVPVQCTCINSTLPAAMLLTGCKALFCSGIGPSLQDCVCSPWFCQLIAEGNYPHMCCEVVCLLPNLTGISNLGYNNPDSRWTCSSDKYQATLPFIRRAGKLESLCGRGRVSVTKQSDIGTLHLLASLECRMFSLVAVRQPYTWSQVHSSCFVWRYARLPCFMYNNSANESC